MLFFSSCRTRSHVKCDAIKTSTLSVLQARRKQAYVAKDKDLFMWLPCTKNAKRTPRRIVLNITSTTSTNCVDASKVYKEGMDGMEESSATPAAPYSCPTLSDAVSSTGKGSVPNQKSTLTPSTLEVQRFLQALAQAAPSKLMIWNPSQTKTIFVATTPIRLSSGGRSRDEQNEIACQLEMAWGFLPPLFVVTHLSVVSWHKQHGIKTKSTCN